MEVADYSDLRLFWHMQGTTEYDSLIGWTELKPVPGLHRLPLELQGEHTAQLSFDLNMSHPSQETFSAGPATASTGVSGGHSAGCWEACCCRKFACTVQLHWAAAVTGTTSMFCIRRLNLPACFHL